MNTSRLTTEEFVRRSRLKHGDKYDYSESHYINWTTKVTIICPEHGPFLQRADRHMNHNGCPRCNSVKIPDLQQLIKECSVVHNNYYTYEQSTYTNANTKTLITCPEHGSFLQLWNQHKSGQGCKKCHTKKISKNLRLTTEQFINRSMKIHGDTYDYSKCQVESKKSKVEIICPIHGSFFKICSEHMRGYGCNKCSSLDSARNIAAEMLKNVDGYTLDDNEVICNSDGSRIPIYDFVRRRKRISPKAIKIKKHDSKLGILDKIKNRHADQYQYSDDIESKSSHDKIKIICPMHGEFEQRLHFHIKGHGCPKCSYIRIGDLSRLTAEEFVARGILVHGTTYLYDNTNYINMSTKVTVTCKTHGDFDVKAHDHIFNRCGCPKCSTSSGQMQLFEFVKSLDPNAILNDRKLISPYEIDIVSHKHKLAIEYHGLYYHSYNRTESADERKSHIFKINLLSEKGYRLYQFFEHEYAYKKEIIHSMIRNRLNGSLKFHARKCELVDLTTQEYRTFVDANHIQGFNAAKHALGLKYGDEILTVMSFREHDTYDFEIVRLANKLGTSVVGGASKLLYHFMLRYPSSKILTFADRRYSIGDVYTSVGFKFIEYTKPNYFYYKGNKILSRQRCQKHKLNKLLESFDPNLTEAENMFLNGYRRVWDAGHSKFVN